MTTIINELEAVLERLDVHFEEKQGGLFGRRYLTIESGGWKMPYLGVKDIRGGSTVFFVRNKNKRLVRSYQPTSESEITARKLDSWGVEFYLTIVTVPQVGGHFIQFEKVKNVETMFKYVVGCIIEQVTQ